MPSATRVVCWKLPPKPRPPGRLMLPVQLCAFHLEELADLVKRQGKAWPETRGKYDWLESRLWGTSKGLKSGL